MRLSSIFSLVSIIARAQVATTAASLNAFTAPVASTVVTAGDVMLISWTNLSGEKATLQLAKGDPCDLVISVVIARDIENKGHAEWTVPAHVEPGKYSMMILPDDGSINYSAFFHIAPFDEVHGCPQREKKERELRGKKTDGQQTEGDNGKESSQEPGEGNGMQPEEGNGQEQQVLTTVTSEGGPMVFTLCHDAGQCVPKYYMSRGTKYVVHHNSATATCCRRPSGSKSPQKNWFQKMLHC